MGKEKDILDLLNNIIVDEDEFNNINIELNDIEKKRIRKKYRQKIFLRKRVLKSSAIMATLVSVIFLGGIAAPAMATSNIPILSNIYESLGIYSDYKDYTKYIGETKKVGKYEYKIEEFMVTPYKSLIGIKIISDDVIPENHQGFMTDIEVGGVHWDSGSSKRYRVNDHTLVTIIEHNYNNKVPKKANITVNIHSIDSDDDANETFGRFQFKADFDGSYNEFTSIEVNNIRFENYGVKLKEINSSIMGTDIVSKIRSKEDSVEDYISKKDKLEYVLKVEDKFYGGDKYSSLDSSFWSGIEGVAITQIDNLKYDQIINANNITLMVYEAKYSNDELTSVYTDDNQSVDKTEQGVSYVEEYKFQDGTKGLLYNLERYKDTVKIHYKGKESDIIPLSKYVGIYSDKIPNRMYYPNIYRKSDLEGEFIIEFKNIPQEDEDLNMTFGCNNEYSLMGEYKIK